MARRFFSHTMPAVSIFLFAIAQVDSVDAANVVAVGVGGTIRQTSDSGGNWFPRTSGTANELNDVDCRRHECWAVGNSGTIIYSQDAGRTWSPQVSGTTRSLHGVSFGDRDIGWAVGAMGTILVTYDGGQNWVLQASNTNLAFLSAIAIDGTTAWLAGESGTIRYTADGGANWGFQTSLSDNSIAAIHVLADGKGGYAGSNVGRTDDYGTSWRRQELVVQPFQVNDIHYANSQVAWIAGSPHVLGAAGQIRKTIDGGETWNNQSSGVAGALNAITMIDAQTGWVAGGAGALRKTSDGGETWTPQFSGTLNTLNDIVSFQVYDTADFDEDGDIDGKDFLAWQKNFGISSGASLAQGDTNADGKVNSADLEIWQLQYADGSGTNNIFSVPEPSGIILILFAVCCKLRLR